VRLVFFCFTPKEYQHCRLRSYLCNNAVEKDNVDNRSNVTARIGKGGAPISLSGINGGVRLTRVSNTEARAPNANQRTTDTDSANSSDNSKDDDDSKEAQ